MYIGALYESNITRQHLLTSRSYFSSVLTWCVQKRQPLPMYMQAFQLCTDYRVLVSFVITGTCAMCAAYYFQQFERRQKWHCFRILFAGISFALGYPSEFNPTTSPNRILVGICAFGFLLCAIVFSTFGMRMISKPYLKPQIRSIDDILASNFTLVGDRFALMKLRSQAMVKTIFHGTQQKKTMEIAIFCNFQLFSLFRNTQVQSWTALESVTILNCASNSSPMMTASQWLFLMNMLWLWAVLQRDRLPIVSTPQKLYAIVNWKYSWKKIFHSSMN